MLSVIETEMLDNLMKLIVGGSKDAAVWQLEKLQQLGKLREMNLKTIKEARGKLLGAVMQELYQEAIKRAQMVDDATAGAGKSLASVMSPEADPALIAVITRWERSAMSKLDSAFAPMLARADAIYTDTIYKAVAKQQIGISITQAIAETCTEWAEQGLTAFVDSAGRNWTPEAYAQTVIRTNMAQAAGETQLQRMEELGEDLVEVSSHLGSRPEHAPFQGRIYSVSGRSKQYPPLSDTGYGTGAGIGGYNCRHVLYPYFPGTEKTFKAQDPARNETAYINSQRQRLLERRIREGKRNYDLLSQAGDENITDAARRKLQNRELAMREFIESTGRKRRVDREKVY